MTASTNLIKVLALEPSTRGIAFAAFGNNGDLIDWGGRETRFAKNAKCRLEARIIARGFAPALIVIEDGDAPGSTRRARIRELLRALAQDLTDEGYVVGRLPRRRVREYFCRYSASSKEDLVNALCHLYPQLSERRPAPRRAWQSEPYSYPLFEAAALGITAIEGRM